MFFCFHFFFWLIVHSSFVFVFLFLLLLLTHIFPFSRPSKKGAVGKLEFLKHKKKRVRGQGGKRRKEGGKSKQWNLKAEKNKPQLNEMGNRAKETIWTSTRNEGKAFLGIHEEFPCCVGFVRCAVSQSAAPALAEGKGERHRERRVTWGFSGLYMAPSRKKGAFKAHLCFLCFFSHRYQ